MFLVFFYWTGMYSFRNLYTKKAFSSYNDMALYDTGYCILANGRWLLTGYNVIQVTMVIQQAGIGHKSDIRSSIVNTLFYINTEQRGNLTIHVKCTSSFTISWKRCYFCIYTRFCSILNIARTANVRVILGAKITSLNKHIYSHLCLLHAH